MRRLALAALAAIALLCSRSAFAQQQVTPYPGRGPATQTFSLVALNDTATVYLSGSSWSTVYWTIATAGGGAITTEISLDGGVNWIASAYSKRIDVVSANPSTVPWANNGPVAGTFETPLPGNCTAFRIRYQTAGTTTSGTITPGLPYAPGVSVVATLFDVTSAVNTDNPTGVFDLSGWQNAFVAFSAGGATTIAVTASQIADDGTTVGGGYTLIAAATAGKLQIARNAVNQGNAVMTKRMSFDVAPVAAQATRLRVEAYR